MKNIYKQVKKMLWVSVTLLTFIYNVYSKPISYEDKVVAITILAEARGEGKAGMYAVAAVIAQRALERKQTPSQVCLAKWQFSCWNGKSIKQLSKLLDVPQASYALQLAKHIDKLDRSFVGHANHYHATWMKKNCMEKLQKTPIETYIKGSTRKTYSDVQLI